ncbi:type VI secretion system baseplate subunit TssK [uncultured Shewanella sp.]|uniref:type VI secretion system baseplate subunit TssK n=1 Tax=uncultured Shewanella sp. TaxID=173975 RepID=UPI002638123C|nr:type VI secretion system baseplate subunit TssK [uncultured Shewanella sp.]
MYDRIHWQDGVLLTASQLIEQDRLRQYNTLNGMMLPYSMDYGIVRLHVDTDLLETGTLKIKKLDVYTKYKYLIKINESDNVSLSLDESVDNAIVPVFLNLQEKLIHEEGLSKVRLTVTLSDNYKEDKIESFKLLELINKEEVWSVYSSSIALLSCDSCTFLSIIGEINKIIASIKHYIKTSQYSKGAYYIFKIGYHHLERIVNMAKKKPNHVHPIEIFNQIDTVYYLISEVENTEYSVVHYDFYNPNTSFYSLFEHLYKILSKPVKQQFVTFEREGDSYLISDLSGDFINASEYFLVLRKLTQEETYYIEVKYLKLSSIERNKHINQMSLSGILLEKMPDDGIHQLNDPFIYQIYSLSHGDELDIVLKDRNIMFKYIKNAEHYQFTLYYR